MNSGIQSNFKILEYNLLFCSFSSKAFVFCTRLRLHVFKSRTFYFCLPFNKHNCAFLFLPHADIVLVEEKVYWIKQHQEQQYRKGKKQGAHYVGNAVKCINGLINNPWQTGRQAEVSPLYILWLSLNSFFSFFLLLNWDIKKPQWDINRRENKAEKNHQNSQILRSILLCSS